MPELESATVLAVSPTLLVREIKSVTFSKTVLILHERQASPVTYMPLSAKSVITYLGVTGHRLDECIQKNLYYISQSAFFSMAVTIEASLTS